MNRSLHVLVSAATIALLVACNKEPPASQSGGTQTSGVQTAPGAVAAGDAARAEVGKPAPDFALKDLDGKDVRLSSFKGKVVVLEWFNPGCPFVDKSHAKGSLKETARKHTKNGVVWLAVNSAAPGKQGHGVEANREGAKKYGMEHPILVDESGDVGKKYGATNTPHMFVIDDKGTLVYRGAIDNSPDGEGEAPTGGKLVSYVDEALSAIAAGKAPATAETKAYGCGVKYGK
jgi:peroxiredoxin